ncbi:O-antigen translocase [Vibrio owensii]|uniref:O-antigen translocase n=1 Tax=Vibrio owensii TaxID=696485 RepID=UPI0028948655|nr:O-antigen translocase [Vibrio owensii]
MKLSNVIIWNGLSVLVKVFTLMGVNKVFAYFAGPAGYAYISQLQNVTNLALVIPVNSINSATIKYTSTLEEKERPEFWKTSFSLMVFFCSIISFALIVCSEYLSIYVFDTGRYWYIFAIYSITIFLFSANSFIISIFNGLKNLKGYVYANILGNISTLILSCLLIFLYRMEGAILSVVLNQALNLVITLSLFRKFNDIPFSRVIGLGSKKEVNKILSFSSMAIFAGLILPFSLMIIRNIIIEFDGIDNAGLWDGVWKISTIYLSLISTTLSVYFLPRFSELKKKDDLKRELLNGSVIVMSLTATPALIIYIFRHEIVSLLFTYEFKDMVNLLKYQLLGDVLKMASWILGYFVISKACIREYIFTETIQWLLFIITAYFFVRYEGVSGVQYAYFLTQILYFFTLVIVVARILSNNVRLSN